MLGEVEVRFVPFQARVVRHHVAIVTRIGGLTAGGVGASVLAGIAAVAGVLEGVLQGEILVGRGDWGIGDGLFGRWGGGGGNGGVRGVVE